MPTSGLAIPYLAHASPPRLGASQQATEMSNQFGEQAGVNAFA